MHGYQFEKGLVAVIFALALSVWLVSPVEAQTLFPKNPVDMRPGYGANGAGLHYGRPEGIPGNDCVINPVSMTHGLNEVEITELVPGDIIVIPATVLFDFDKSNLRLEGISLLQDEIYASLIEFGVFEIAIVGHTDSKGTEEYNDALGLRRASAVADNLVSLGFPREGITISSAGELIPIAKNVFEDGSDNPEGRQLNRRVELEVRGVELEEVTKTEEVVYERNPQIFHRLSSDSTVLCGGELAEDSVFRYWLWK